jgi:hypothetical protein
MACGPTRRRFYFVVVEGNTRAHVPQLRADLA